ncbi:MAG: peptidase S10 [Planctomycetota bacterium]
MTHWTALISVLALAVPALQEAEKKEPKSAPKSFARELEGRFGAVDVKYTATVAETILTDDKDKPEASIWSTAYVQRDVADPATRPVTFLWNGGPGSSSVWLHMGAFGPKRVDVPSDAKDDGGPPYRLIDNPECFLDLSDIVFVDPVGTGFSKPLGETQGSAFWGVQQDARSIARFIRRWISDHQRWNSPKFIGGESYGTTRAAAVVNELEGGFDDVALNGVLLISAILDFSADATATGNELAYALNVPTYAATAWFHGLAGEGQTIEAFVTRARHFALGEYMHGLLLGESLAAEDRARLARELAELTGLARDYVEHSNLRIRPDRFQKELLRARGLTVGRLDSRYTGVDLDRAGESPENDPSFYGIDGAYASAINAWLRGALGVDVEPQYRIIGGLSGGWDWGLGDPFYVNVAPYLGQAMRENSGLHVFVACGYYDMATPFFGAEYSLNRSGVVPARVHYAYYEAGHMMYVNHPSLAKLQKDVRAFLASALAR